MVWEKRDKIGTETVITDTNFEKLLILTKTKTKEQKTHKKKRNTQNSLEEGKQIY